MIILTDKEINDIKTDVIGDISILLSNVNTNSLSNSTVLANVIFEKCQKLFIDQENKIKRHKKYAPFTETD